MQDTNKPPANSSGKKSIFDKNKDLGALRGDVRQKFKEMADKTKVLHTMNPQEKLNLEKELFPYDRYGGYISRQEVDKKILEMRKSVYSTKDPLEKAKIQDRIDYLNNLKTK